MNSDTLTSPVLREVIAGNLCSGCGACASVAPQAIRMRLSQDGFLRPEQTGPVAGPQEAGIAGACPGLGMRQDAAGRRDDPLWGPYISLQSGHANDPALRRQASSGGVLSALLVHLLKLNLVDGIVLTGADPDLPIGSRTRLISDASGVYESAGSRYAPSAPLADVHQLAATDLRYAFVGKPCDVAALRAMQRSDSILADRFPYVLSFFCAGVPSLLGAREVLSAMGAEERRVVRFRYRGDGWPGQATAVLQDGTERRMSYADSWGGILSRHVQFRCKVCPDGTGGFADVVCADAWDTDSRGYPLFAESPGRSLVMARTELGVDLVRAATAAGAIRIFPYEIGQLAAVQPGQTRKRRAVLARLAALKLAGRRVPEFRGFHLVECARQAGAARNLRDLLGTLRRVFLGRL